MDHAPAHSIRKTVAVGVGPNDRVYSRENITIVMQALAEETATRPASARPAAHARKSRSAYVSLNQIIEQYCEAAARSRTPWFAYRAGLRFHVSTYGMYGFAILSSTDFRRTNRFAVQYHELATPVVEIAFTEQAGTAIWTIVPVAHPRVDAALYRFLVELAFGTIMSLSQDIMGAEFAPRELHVTYAAQGNPAAYSAAFGCPVKFEHPRNEFIYDPAWLDRKPELGNDTSFSEMLKLCDERLANLRFRVGLLGRVRSILILHLTRPPSLKAAAGRLYMSPRTLRRKLQEQKLTFRALLAELRSRLAIQYLRDTRLSIEDIAIAVGFSDAANFRHAFRRWTGSTPRQFRLTFQDGAASTR